MIEELGNEGKGNREVTLPLPSSQFLNSSIPQFVPRARIMLQDRREFAHRRENARKFTRKRESACNTMGVNKEQGERTVPVWDNGEILDVIQGVRDG